jgi:hypothetical protein
LADPFRLAKIITYKEAKADQSSERQAKLRAPLLDDIVVA